MNDENRNSYEFLKAQIRNHDSSDNGPLARKNLEISDL